jgi:uncharacterized spore protein YtfJ
MSRFAIVDAHPVQRQRSEAAMATTQSIDVEHVLSGARDAITVRKVYGEPIERDGLTVVPAAKVRGGGGGGGGTGPDDDEGRPTGSGSGAGFGVAAQPAGAFVIRGDDVEWRPALDVQKLALAGIALAGLVVLALRSVIVRR